MSDFERDFHTALEEPEQSEESIGPEVEAADEWPRLSPLALCGLAGDVVNTIEPHTEADPVAILFQFLVMFGNAVGGAPYFNVGADEHRANLNVLLVGDTSTGRKGMSEGQARRIFKSADPEWAKTRTVGGLSTGEGLVAAVQDKDDGSSTDKRLLVFEAEFARTLRVMRREGSTLSPIIRSAWDSGNLSVMTRGDPLRATDAHISIVGHATPSDLLRHMDSNDTENGFANRFLFVRVRRSKSLPDGGSLTDADLSPLSKRTEGALDAARRTLEVRRDDDGRTLWHSVYDRLTEPRPGLLGVVTARAAAQVVRLALVYALLDSSRLVRRNHLEAALAVWNYAELSARQIFGESLGDPWANHILEELRALRPEWMKRTDISDALGRHAPARDLEVAFRTLKRSGLAETRRDTTTGGRPSELWRAL
jgi:hypothetical protein